MEPFGDLKLGSYGAIYADPPWRFQAWSPRGEDRSPDYPVMSADDLYSLPVSALAAPDSVLFLWVTWPLLDQGFMTMDAWGFKYKTCAFAWMKANGQQADLFNDEIEADMLLGYWTRANSEVCLLGTRGKPKRLNADVRQGIIEPRREHSRKPNCVYDRIERLVAGPYVELFARQRVAGWDACGNETGKWGELRDSGGQGDGAAILEGLSG
jgi:N6-adenosine-specific RNA methylase IME4